MLVDVKNVEENYYYYYDGKEMEYKVEIVVKRIEMRD